MIPGMHTSLIERSQPGIRFETASPAVPESMPRMDVAAFIGFAERGPLHWPVVIEDMMQFEQVFGTTAQLGWGGKGERISGNLAESISSFFIQGGQRCWVVRVAGSSASSNQFVLPGLFTVTPSTAGYCVLPALAQARCEGSWSDPLRVATRLLTRPVVIEKISTTATENTWELRTRADTARAGDLLRIVRESGKRQAFFYIEKIERDNATGEILLYALSAIAFRKVDVQGDISTAAYGSWTKDELGRLSDWMGEPTSLVSIDLRVRDGQFSEWRAENLGLTPLHPRYCGALPTDTEKYRGDTSASGLSQQTSPFNFNIVPTPWFPLAAKVSNIEYANASFMVPLDMDGMFSLENPANANATSQLERDGLSNFDASLFLDCDLRTTSLAELMATADAIRYSAPEPRPLTGIHAVLGWFNTTIQDEVTLIAVPDAVHMPWQSRPTELRYTIDCAEIPTKTNSDKPEAFSCCSILAAPFNLAASAATPSGTKLQLSWEMPDGLSNTVIEYQVQESINEDFLFVDRSWTAVNETLDITISAPVPRMFRVCAKSATHTSQWSAVIAVSIGETEPGAEQSSASGKITLEIQRALIRLCAAQGELFSVISLPQTINQQDASNHVFSLSATQADGTSANKTYLDPEGRVGSYAAIYHPWVEARSTSGSIKSLPPEGAILGMIAARARAQGAWIAPANRILRNVVALHTELPALQQTLLLDAGVNLVLHRPEGYTLWSEDTLSGVSDLRPIHVRRLLILLRRILLRLGEEFTFETNGQALRALVRQRCTSMLERMFRAGAFAGRSSAEAFQVSVDDTDNPPASIDAGRLIVRIRVRPAQALRFLTLRLSLGGGATGVSEENAA